MSDLIISVSGLRGIVGEALTPEVAIRFTAAFAEGLPEGPVIVSRDGRTTGPMLMDAVRCSLQALGRTVIDAGVAATPTTGVLVAAHEAAGGVQISASHNPPPYNGIKLFSAEGRVLPADAGQRVLERYRANDVPPWATHEGIGCVEVCRDPIGEHLQRVLAGVAVERIRARRFRVLLDANHGAGAQLGRPLLEALGCQVRILGEAPSGEFWHPPEPTAENLRAVADQREDAEVVFCQDPDADRLAVLDEQGRYIGEEYSLALCLDHVLQTRTGNVVANCATSRLSEEVARRRGAAFYRSAVGEANVVNEMLRREAVFGGEGNGGPIDPRVGWVRDSFVGMALILDGLAARQEPLSQWVAELPRFFIHKTQASLPREAVADALASLESRFADAEADYQDGLRLVWNDRWLLIRASNTEPIVRFIAEAPAEEVAQQMCRDAQQCVTGT